MKGGNETQRKKRPKSCNVSRNIFSLKPQQYTAKKKNKRFGTQRNTNGYTGNTWKERNRQTSGKSKEVDKNEQKKEHTNNQIVSAGKFNTKWFLIEKK